MNILLDIDPWTLISFALWKEIFFFFCLKKGNRKKWPLCSSLSQFLIYSKSFSIIFSSFFSKFHNSMELTNLCISIVFSAPYQIITIIYGKSEKKRSTVAMSSSVREAIFFHFLFLMRQRNGRSQHESTHLSTQSQRSHSVHCNIFGWLLSFALYSCISALLSFTVVVMPSCAIDFTFFC